TLGRNILPLERDGLIRIEAMPSDRRAKELHLTTRQVRSACKWRRRDGPRPKRDLKPYSAQGVRQNCAKCSGQSSQAMLGQPTAVALSTPTPPLGRLSPDFKAGANCHFLDGSRRRPQVSPPSKN